MTTESFLCGNGIFDVKTGSVELVFGEFKKCCETFSVNDDGEWFFMADFTKPEFRDIIDGECHDFLTEHFEILMSLRTFHEGKFYIQLKLGGIHPEFITINPMLVAMYSALGIEIEIVVEKEVSNTHNITESS